jgi:hypothetical protein
MSNIIHELTYSNWQLRYNFWLKVLPFTGTIRSTDRSNDWGGKRPIPGSYISNVPILIKKGNLTLDAKGDPNARWIFKTTKNIITVSGEGGNIILIGGAQPKNIFWETDRNIQLGSGTSFIGNLQSNKSNSWKITLRNTAFSIFYWYKCL